MKKVMALMALTILTACDSADRSSLRRERESRLYQSAMADYQAGRVDAAIAGFEKVASAEPANAEARFQLGCLLQDNRKDWLNAFCAYREFLSQRPGSDKADLARNRMATCEVELARALAAKYRLTDADSAQIALLQQSLKSAETAKATLEKELEAVRQRSMALATEREQLLKAVKGFGEGEASEAAAPSIAKEARDLLEESDESSGDRVKISADAAALRQADDADEIPTGPSLLPERKSEDLVKRKEREAAEAEKEAARREAMARAANHPATYVVQEGDTLYRIAVRFYGRISAWKSIRDANKATISNDGRVRSGQVIKLP